MFITRLAMVIADLVINMASLGYQDGTQAGTQVHCDSGESEWGPLIGQLTCCVYNVYNYNFTRFNDTYDTYNYSIHGVYKLMYNWGEPHCCVESKTLATLDFTWSQEAGPRSDGEFS